MYFQKKKKDKRFTDDELAGSRITFEPIRALHLKHSFELELVAERHSGAFGGGGASSSCTDADPGLLDTCQLFALSVGPETGVCENVWMVVVVGRLVAG